MTDSQQNKNLESSVVNAIKDIFTKDDLSPRILKQWYDEKLQSTVTLYDEKLSSRDQARELQAIEYERRLRDLNGEADRIRQILKDSIPREVFDRTMSEKDQRFERMVGDVMKRIEDLTTWKNAMQGSDTGKDNLTKYIPWLIALGALLWGIFKPK